MCCLCRDTNLAEQQAEFHLQLTNIWSLADMSRTTQLLPAGEAMFVTNFERVRASEAQQAGCAAAQTLLRAGEDEVSSEGVTGPKWKKLRDGDNCCHSDDTMVVRAREEAVVKRLAVSQVGRRKCSLVAVSFCSSMVRSPVYFVHRCMS